MEIKPCCKELKELEVKAIENIGKTHYIAFMETGSGGWMFNFTYCPHCGKKIEKEPLNKKDKYNKMLDRKTFLGHTLQIVKIEDVGFGIERATMVCCCCSGQPQLKLNMDLRDMDDFIKKMKVKINGN